eukprot:13542291-Alexandrium_andersonii.AAC.1
MACTLAQRAAISFTASCVTRECSAWALAASSRASRSKCSLAALEECASLTERTRSTANSS